MGSYILSYSISQKVVAVPKFPRISFRIFWIASLTLIFFLLFFNIFQINKITQASFLITGLGGETQELYQQNKILESNFLKNNSLGNLENLVGGLGFEKVEKVDYIQVREGAIVTN